MKDIFISYKSEEYNIAKWVKDYLVKCGLSVWMAPEDIGGGENYASCIPEAIENCKAFVLILSENAQNSKWVTRELDQAINHDKEIMPFMIRKCELTKAFRFYLANIQCYPAYEDMAEQLIKMTREIMDIPGITLTKPGEKKAEAVQNMQPKPPAKSEPSFAGTGLKTDAEKFRYAVDESTRLYENPEATVEDKNRAFELLEWAARKGDPEAAYRFGVRLVNGKTRLKDVNSKERGMFYVNRAAYLGHKGAREAMDRYCTILYERDVGSKIPLQAPAPLRDFDNWRIKINHTGKLPVNAVLDFNGQVNTLCLTVNVNITMNDDEVAHWGRMEKAVIDGFKAWEGVYRVFGGQKLGVIVDVNVCDRILGVVNIMSARGDMAKNVMKFSGLLGSTARKRSEDTFTNYHTFSTVGMKKWSVKSNKSIIIYDNTGRFDDYEQIKREIRCEFGTILGLDSVIKTDNGKELLIPKGTYPELDPYYIEDGRYNLLMCNGRGMITNNDIEMVILALAENEMQYYLEDSHGHKPSKALGRGN